MLTFSMSGKRAFVAGIGDDRGFGWTIAKMLRAAGADVIIGVWTPLLKTFQTALERGKFDASRTLPDGSLLEFAAIYPIDALFDTPDEVPEEIAQNKRYKDVEGYTVSEVAKKVAADFGSIDYLVHSLANSPEIKHSLLDTSRAGYLTALSSSSYSLISLLRYFSPLMNPGSAALSLTYLAAERVVPGYGGGMSSAKAALESDTRTLAWELGRKHGIRVNTISAGALASRAAKAIGFIERMITYQERNAPLASAITPEEVAKTALFLLSDWASGITGETLFVDKGLNIMGVAVESPSLQGE